MAKLTTLQYVQRALSKLDSDNVSDIDETVESEQVKLLLDEAYEEILEDFPWFHLQEYGQLEVTATAHIMKIPDTIATIDGNLIRYNELNVTYISPERMTEILDGRDTDLATVDSNGARNDLDPLNWTTEDDENIIFDSYDGSLVQALSKVRMIRLPGNLTNNTSVPDLPDRLHVVLQNRLYEEVFRTLKGDEQSAQVYHRKYLRTLAKAKRWARKVDQTVSTHGQSYGKRANTSVRRRDIPSRFIQEGS